MKQLPVIDLAPFLLYKATAISIHNDSSAACAATAAYDEQSATPVKDMSQTVSPTSSPIASAAALPEAVLAACRAVAECLKGTSALIVKDPRCSAADSNEFLDTMERYFEQGREEKMRDARPHLHFQVGVTPEAVEVPRCSVDESLRAEILSIPEPDRPHLPSGPDPKWRFMWRVGPRPAETKFQELNSQPVIPAAFPNWAATMDGWGSKMLSAVEIVAEMAAIGLGLPADAFTSLMHEGPHLLAPTGSDLATHGKKGTVFAGYHYDLNFLTIHGRSRFPGLFIWLRNGRRVSVSVPEGCLLLQAGKQMEWLTGGEIKAGMHEVVVTDATLNKIEEAKASQRSLWRVSSTVFSHIASDHILRPLAQSSSDDVKANYAPILAGEFVEMELSAINLKGSNHDDKDKQWMVDVQSDLVLVN